MKLKFKATEQVDIYDFFYKFYDFVKWSGRLDDYEESGTISTKGESNED